MTGDYRRFALTRAGQAIVVVLLAYVLTFLIISVLPGDAITNTLRDPQHGLSEEDIQRIVAFYGLDQPVIVQLLLSLGRFLTGELGFSLQSNLPVAQIVGDALPSTLTLATTALFIAIIFAVVIAYGAQYLPGKWAAIVRSIPSFFLSVPNFVIGLVLIEFFAFRLHSFTTTDPNSPIATLFAAITLAIPVSAPLAEVLIASLDHESRQEYAVVARSRGLTEAKLFAKHLVKPSALPSVAMVALIVGELLGGSVITETIFGRDGIGTVVQKAVTGEDQPVLQAVVSLSAVVFVAVNLVADLASPLLDPRVKLRETKLREKVGA
ncbi:peptide/nickel transport system permease protein [Paenarthrobacter nitroguajacolicus]|uniref:ABC transporter permease n=1 Tax=Paenarthrobacter TaxID=1742992 RepID=UPI00285E1B9E|nr:ABC transporter permease [Paenarthrobacter nitroguajacolicus]MDR6988610.1 peptide/nickel transport system permease protein [Paenarthrobacter nitroguajacolicus]